MNNPKFRIALICAKNEIYQHYIKYKMFGINAECIQISDVRDLRGRRFNLMVVETSSEDDFDCDVDELIAATKACLH